MGAATISDVAKLAGVSIKTVSRVLNSEPAVRAETRERVDRAIKELAYRPNLSARSLAGARSYLIGILTAASGALEVGAEYTLRLQLGALKKCQDLGYHLIVHAIESTAEDFDNAVAMLTSNVIVDGYVLSPPLCDNDALLDALDAKGCPYVRIAPYRNKARSPHIWMDDAGAAFELTRRLLDLGHRDIAFIAGHPDHGATHLRLGGYSAAMRAYNVPLDESRIKQGDFLSSSGIRLGEELLSGPSRPTAVFASNDAMALGVLFAANRLGLRVPQDLSICGFDDTPAATLVWPQLTTVRQPVNEMSARAAELLVRQDREAKGHLFDFELIERGSTGPVLGAA